MGYSLRRTNPNEIHVSLLLFLKTVLEKIETIGNYEV